MAGYNLMINEEQRVALLSLIDNACADEPDAPLEYWTAMLRDLPKEEAENPGITHGFCL